MSLEASAVLLRIPCDFGRTANDFGWRKIAVTTTHDAEGLSQEWKNQYIYIANTHASATVEIGLSLDSAAEIDTTAAAAADPGTSLKVGFPVPPATLLRIKLPDWDDTKTAYLIHEGTAALTMYIGKGSGAQ